jgi:hypothetical protein
MPAKLFLTETEARGVPFGASQLKLSELIDDYGDTVSSGSLLATEEVLLAPVPIDCELPRRGHDPAMRIWGYAKSSLVGYGRRVAAVSTEVGIDPENPPGQRPRVDDALHLAGTIWTSKSLERVGSVAERFWQTGQPSVDVQPDALNLRLITTSRAREQFRAIESASDGHRALRSPGVVPKTPATWGRVIFVNDPSEAPPDIPVDSFEEISFDSLGQSVKVRAHAAQRKMLGTDAPYLVVVVCGGTFEVELATQISALLRRSLEHSVASEWLVARAEQVNDRQAECMVELLDRETSPGRIENLRQQLGMLRYTFVDELEFVWDYDVDQRPEARELYSLINRATGLTYRWRRELARFERLISVGDVAHSAGFVQSRPQIEIPEAIPGFEDESNVLSQVRLWWHHRRSSHDGSEHKMPALQRPGMRQRNRVPHGARKIELHPFRNRAALFSELSASIALTSFMTAASAVFLGVVLQRGVRSSLPMDVLFLFIATFGFLFATLIYANASGRLARHGTFGYESQVEIANRVSEYLGVFPLLVAIPLSVSRFLASGPIPWAVAGLALLATVAYHYVRGASLLERDISDERIGSDRQRKLIFVPALAGLMTVTFLGQLLHSGTLEVVGAVGFGLLSLLMVLLSAMLPERTNPQEYLVDEWDLLSDETPSIPVDPSDAIRDGEIRHEA